MLKISTKNLEIFKKKSKKLPEKNLEIFNTKNIEIFK